MQVILSHIEIWDKTLPFILSEISSWYNNWLIESNIRYIRINNLKFRLILAYWWSQLQISFQFIFFLSAYIIKYNIPLFKYLKYFINIPIYWLFSLLLLPLNLASILTSVSFRFNGTLLSILRGRVNLLLHYSWKLRFKELYFFL